MHLFAAVSSEAYFSHAIDFLQHGTYEVIGDPGEFIDCILTGQGEPDHRLSINILLVHGRDFRVIRQIVQFGGYLVPHFLRRNIDVLIQFKFNRNP